MNIDHVLDGRAPEARPDHIPVVCLNGTPREELRLQRERVVDALRQAQRLLQDAAPHGRDYQIGGNYPLAVAAHLRRYQDLDGLAEEILQELEWL